MRRWSNLVEKISGEESQAGDEKSAVIVEEIYTTVDKLAVICLGNRGVMRAKPHICKAPFCDDPNPNVNEASLS